MIRKVLVLFATIAVLYSHLNPALAQVYSNGVYTLTCNSSGLALDNEGATGGNYPVWQWSPMAGNVNQKWMISSLGNGYYTLICMRSGMALDTNGKTSNGSVLVQNPVQQNNLDQQWSITSGGRFTLFRT